MYISFVLYPSTPGDGQIGRFIFIHTPSPWLFFRHFFHSIYSIWGSIMCTELRRCEVTVYTLAIAGIHLYRYEISRFPTIFSNFFGIVFVAQFLRTYRIEVGIFRVFWFLRYSVLKISRTNGHFLRFIKWRSEVAGNPYAKEVGWGRGMHDKLYQK